MLDLSFEHFCDGFVMILRLYQKTNNNKEKRVCVTHSWHIPFNYSFFTAPFVPYRSPPTSSEYDGISETGRSSGAVFFGRR